MNRAATTFLGLESTTEESVWRLPVTLRNIGGSGFLHGGCALAASIEALEAVTGRPLVWGSGQYMSRAALGEVVDLRLSILAAGNRFSQCAVIGTLAGVLVFEVRATVGGHDLGIDQQYLAMPDVPPPGECESRPDIAELASSFTNIADVRVASADPGGPMTSYWCSLPDRIATTSAGLAMFGDLVPSAMRVSQQQEYRGNSLDNTVRCSVGAGDHGQWLLVDARTEAFDRSVGHGTAVLWSQAGRLLGIASQSFGVSKVTG